METMIIKIVICIALPLFFLCGFVEKKSRQILFAVLLGALACLLAYIENTHVYHYFGFSYYYLSTNIAPFNEELFKFLPILLFAKLDNDNKEYILAISFAAGMGFAIVENSLMLSQYASNSTILWMIIRGIGTGLMHGISTSIVGIGVYLSCKDKRMIFTGTLATLFLAMMFHGAYNAIIQVESIKYFGIFIPLISYGIIISILHKQKLNKILKEKDMK